MLAFILIAAVSDVVWQAVIAAVLSVFLALINVWSAYITKKSVEAGTQQAVETAHVAASKVERVAVKADAAVVKVEEVKQTLVESTKSTDEKLDAIAKTADAVHVLVNSSMSAQLKISAVALRRVADFSRHKDDIAAAELAERLFHEHEKKQANVDAKGASNA